VLRDLKYALGEIPWDTLSRSCLACSTRLGTYTLRSKSRRRPAHTADYCHDDEVPQHNAHADITPLPPRPFDTGPFGGKGADRTQTSTEPFFQRVQGIAPRTSEMWRLTIFAWCSLTDVHGSEDGCGKHVGQERSDGKLALELGTGVELAQGVTKHRTRRPQE
jgi:hypothetical protein